MREKGRFYPPGASASKPVLIVSRNDQPWTSSTLVRVARAACGACVRMAEAAEQASPPALSLRERLARYEKASQLTPQPGVRSPNGHGNGAELQVSPGAGSRIRTGGRTWTWWSSSSSPSTQRLARTHRERVVAAQAGARRPGVWLRDEAATAVHTDSRRSAYRVTRVPPLPSPGWDCVQDGIPCNRYRVA